MFFTGPYHIALFDKDPGKDNFEVIPVAGPGNHPSPRHHGLYDEEQHTERGGGNLSIYDLCGRPGEISMGKGSQRIPVVRLPVNKERRRQKPCIRTRAGNFRQTLQ